MKWKAIIVFAVPDPDLEIRCVCVWGGGGGGGGRSPKNIFSALWTSLWSKNKGGGVPPGLLPEIGHCFVSS